MQYLLDHSLSSTDDQAKVARTVVTALGYLPLTIAHVAGFVGSQGCTLKEYLQLLGKFEANNVNHKVPKDYENTNSRV